jgi:hypothetical protein
MEQTMKCEHIIFVVMKLFGVYLEQGARIDTAVSGPDT